MFGYLKGVRDMANLVTLVQGENTALREELARERTARFFAMTRMAELRTEQASTLADLKSRLAIAQGNFEWLSAMHNQASAERAQLMSARIGVAVPAATVALRRDAEAAGQGQPLEDPPNVAEMAVSDDLFEDVGDRAASVLGLEKTRVYDDPASLLET